MPLRAGRGRRANQCALRWAASALGLLLCLQRPAEACTVFELMSSGFAANAVHLMHAEAVFGGGLNGTFFVDSTHFAYKCSDGGAGALLGTSMCCSVKPAAHAVPARVHACTFKPAIIDNWLSGGYTALHSCRTEAILLMCSCFGNPCMHVGAMASSGYPCMARGIASGLPFPPHRRLARLLQRPGCPGALVACAGGGRRRDMRAAHL